MKTTVIAGAGIIGLSTALELARRGEHVVVLERGRMLEQASWAAAGMLAAHDPENPQALAELARFSLSLYPEFLERLQGLAGLKLIAGTSQTLQLCEDLRRVPASGIILSSEEIMRRVPGVQVKAGQVPVLLEETSVDPRDLARIIAAATTAMNVDVRQETPVLSVSEHGSRLKVRTPQETVIADSLVVAMGAWSSSSGKSLYSLPAGAIVPRKGQMLRMKQPSEGLDIVLRSKDIYIVPRGNGSLVVGATVEDAGFDRTVRADATTWLLRHAGEVWKPLGEVAPANVEEAWTGIRPGTPDQLPLLGNFKHPRIFFATGHYRNGILLTPGTAHVLVQLVLGEEPAVDLHAFDPDRFSKNAVASQADGRFVETR